MSLRIGVRAPAQCEVLGDLRTVTPSNPAAGGAGGVLQIQIILVLGIAGGIGGSRVVRGAVIDVKENA